MSTLPILRHALLQIVRQPLDVLRIFLLPLSATFLIFKLSGLAFTLSPFYVNIAIARGQMPWGRFALGLAVTMAIGFWAAAAWHRFILLSDRPRRWWPTVPWPVYLAFLRRGLLVGLLIFVLIFLGAFVYGIVLGVAAGFTKQPPGIVAQAIGLSLFAAVTVPSLRLAVALPGAAVEAPHSIGTIWRQMSDLFFTLLGLLIALAVLRYLAGEALDVLNLTPLSTVGLIVFAILESLQIILMASIVTTLYGRYVEGRDLV